MKPHQPMLLMYEGGFMIDAVAAGGNVLQFAVRAQAPRSASSTGNVTAFDIAQQIQEVQVSNLKRTLDAQTQVLDLLV